MNALTVKLLKCKIARRGYYRDQAVSLSEQAAGLYADSEIAIRVGDTETFNRCYKDSVVLRRKAEWYIRKASIRELEIRRNTGEISDNINFFNNGK